MWLSDFLPRVGLGWGLGIAGKEFENVVVDNNLREVDVFPAVGTLSRCLETGHALSADGVVHGADDDWLFLPAVVLAITDVTLVYCVLELLGETAAVGHITI